MRNHILDTILATGFYHVDISEALPGAAYLVAPVAAAVPESSCESSRESSHEYGQQTEGPCGGGRGEARKIRLLRTTTTVFHHPRKTRSWGTRCD
jgi:hypothetical protein